MSFGNYEVDRALKQLEENWATAYGVKRSRRASFCAHTLLGKKRCPDLYDTCRVPGGDHLSLWNLNGKPAIIVSQPYDKVDTVALGVWSNHWGLVAHVYMDPAWHFPGRVLQVEIMTPEIYKQLLCKIGRYCGGTDFEQAKHLIEDHRQNMETKHPGYGEQ